MTNLPRPSTQFIAASTHVSMPWKNGGGTTIEIISHPQGSTVNNFEWRLSMAKVDVDGPFSVFPNVQRTLSVLDGQAMVLDIEGFGKPQILTPASQPLSFGADIPTQASLSNGPITDLNIMTHNRKWTHKVKRYELTTPQELTPTSTETIIFAQTNGISIQMDKAYSMSKNDSLILHGQHDKIRMIADNQGTVIVVSLARNTEK